MKWKRGTRKGSDDTDAVDQNGGRLYESGNGQKKETEETVR
jgi:hypothetical protein